MGLFSNRKFFLSIVSFFYLSLSFSLLLSKPLHSHPEENNSIADTPQIEQDAPAPQEALTDEQAAEIIAQLTQLENVKSVVGNLLQRLEYAIQGIIERILNRQVIIKNDKEASFANLSAMQKYVNNLRETSFMSAELMHPEDLLVAIGVVKNVQTILELFLKSNLQKYPDAEQQQRSLKFPNFSTLDEISTYAHTDLVKKMEEIEKRTKNIGLSFFNRTYRKFEKFATDYKLFSRFGKSILGIAGLSAFILAIKEQTFEAFFNTLPNLPGKSFLQKHFMYLKNNIIGQTPEFLGGKLDREGKNYTLLSELYADLGPHGDLQLISLALGLPITWKLFWHFFEDSYARFSAKAYEKWFEFLQILRGGAKVKTRSGGKVEPRYTFADMIGNEYIKKELQVYVDYFCNRENYEHRNIVPRPYILLAGKSRVGKTYGVEVLAGEIKLAREAHGITEEFTLLIFEVEQVLAIGIKTILAYAQMCAPCVVFIDELDLAGANRTQNKEALSDLLTALDGIETRMNKGVLVICATSEPESLDAALLKPGRFSVIQLDYPTLEERREFINRECKARSIIINDDTFIDKLARETKGLPYEKIREITLTAAQLANLDRSSITQEHLKRALDMKIRGILDADINLTPLERIQIAAFLAGETLIAHKLYTDKTIEKVTIAKVIRPIKEESIFTRFEKTDDEDKKPFDYGRIFTHCDKDIDLESVNDLLAECCVRHGGYLAQEILYGENSVTTYRWFERNIALNYAKHIILNDLTKDDLPKNVYQEKLEQAYKLNIEQEERARTILLENKDTLAKLAHALEERITLDKAEIDQILSDTSELDNQDTAMIEQDTITTQ